MESYNKRDKLSMVKLLFVLNMLDEPHCFINTKKSFVKNSTNVKDNISPNNLGVKKDWKDKMNAKFILPLQEINIEDDTKCKKKKDEINTTAIINHENNESPNNLGVKKDWKDKMNAKFILPLQEITIGDDTKCKKKKDEINTTDINNHENNVSPNNLGVKKSEKEKMNTESILPFQEINPNTSEVSISTLPLIIGEKNIDIPIELTFKLKNSALDVKIMKKDVYLTNCRLLPLYGKDDISHSLNGKLYLEGFIRNKLDFSIAKGVENNIINLETECVIIYIPFKCTSLIQYKVPPVLSIEKSLDYIPIYISSDCEDINNKYHKDFNAYLNKKDTQCKEYIKCDIEPINCEIKKVKINETYTLVDKTPFNKDFPIEINFNTIKENIIINLSLTFIQKQDVSLILNNAQKYF